MKINDIKHNHSLTDLLKVGIFSILMCAPLIAIGSTCAYAIVNKNAYMSYSNFNADNKQYSALTQWNELTSGTTYMLISNNKNNNLPSSNSPRFMVNNINVVSSNQSQSNIDIIESADSFALWRNNNVTYIRFYDEASTILTNGFNNLSIQFTFEYVNNYNFDTTNNLDTYTGGLVYKSHLINTTNTLDNAFYYATEKMTQSDLFNWTQNTAIYTGVSAMCTQLDIQTNVIPILIVYWFILTIIYVIIDIVIKCFTTLTHMLSKETH